MLTDEDKVIWEAYTKTVTPLKDAKTTSRLKDFGRRLVGSFHFKRKEKISIPNTLDLHGFTLEESYALFIRFLNYHFENQTRKIVVITGKGREGKGLLKNEFPKWLEADQIKEKIQTSKRPILNDGGAFELILKQRKR